ncbi:serine/Arginine-related protein 53 isoform X3 [Cylas formicarius]|uniref:serine/Arginine-related protein 53 isoform X3 n=1 Tax=Cylas formicarius TaxID=197179 RepID=UPI002958889D|nr:serine/Arginine-related protein 53 isoform X3 [Cylas formicarius]
MGKYSSDSENENWGSKSSKSRRRRRSSSSTNSSSSRSRYRRDSRKSTRGSKSRDNQSLNSSSSQIKSKKYDNSSKRKSRYDRNSSRERRRRSSSRDNHTQSCSRDNYHRSKSRDLQQSKYSRSKSYIGEYTNKPKKRSSTSSDSSSTDKEKSSRKVNKSINEAACSKSLHLENHKQSKNDAAEVITFDDETIDKINQDKFVPKQFVSNKAKNLPDNIVIDLKKQTIKVPEVEPLEPDSIFHHNLFLNEEARMEKWVKELYSYRQKALQQGFRNNH